MSRHAILIANWEYKSSKFSPLSTPGKDIKDLQEGLSDLNRGNFTVTPVVNKRSADVWDDVRAALDAADKDDLVLVYFSGHGSLDSDDELMLAVDKSDRDSVTMVAFKDLVDAIMIRNFTRSIIMLDCCYSGNAGKEFKSDDAIGVSLAKAVEGPGFSVADIEHKGAAAALIEPATKSTLGELGNTAVEDSPYPKIANATGHYLITATRPFERAAGDLATGHGVFSGALIRGLTGQDADTLIEAPDGDGQWRLTVRNLFKYIAGELTKAPGVAQRPLLFKKGPLDNDSDLVITEIKRPQHQPIAAHRRWTLLKDIRTHILQGMSPTFILDLGFNFIDWNVAFEVVFATPLQLCRGMYVGDFVDQLDNKDELNKTGASTFGGPDPPPIHIEPVIYTHPHYERLSFQKIVTQVQNAANRRIGWLATLNIASSDCFWKDFERAYKVHDCWTLLASVFDSVIAPTVEFQMLVKAIAGKIKPDTRTILDLGSGTGNSTLTLCQSPIARKVTAVDDNDAMLARLASKLATSPFQAQTTLIKGDARSALRDFANRRVEFDACVMMRVFDSVDDSVGLLQATFDVLKKGGRLVIETFHQATNVRALFAQIHASLNASSEQDPELERAFEVASRCTQYLAQGFKRHSISDILTALRAAGFFTNAPSLFLRGGIAVFVADKP